MTKKFLGFFFLELALVGSAYSAPESIVIGKKGGEVMQAVYENGKYIFRTCDSGSEITPNVPCENYSREKVFNNRAHLYASVSDALVSSDSYSELKNNDKLRKKEKDIVQYGKKFGQDKIDQTELKELRYDIEVSDAKLKKAGLQPSDLARLTSEIEQFVAQIESPVEHVKSDSLSETIFSELSYSDVFFEEDIQRECRNKYSYTRPRNVDNNRLQLKIFSLELEEKLNTIISKYEGNSSTFTNIKDITNSDLELSKNPDCAIRVYAIKKPKFLSSDRTFKHAEVKVNSSLPGLKKMAINLSDDKFGWVEPLDEQGEVLSGKTLYGDEAIKLLQECFVTPAFAEKMKIEKEKKEAEEIKKENEANEKRQECLTKGESQKTVRELAYFESIIKDGPFKLDPSKKPVFNGERASGKETSESAPSAAPTKRSSKK